MNDASPPISIRPVTRADVDAVLALWRAVFPEYAEPARAHRDPAASIARKLDFGDGLFWLAERGGRVVGTAMAGWDGHRGWLYSVGVHPEARRGGVGASLVREAERQLAARGCPKVNLQVLAGNEAALAFWGRVGYAQDAVVPMGKRL
ncbi:MAG TPA: GNAT family acetyltransferase [Anaeromyxobacter sp.]|nr:GNAT family acetyltransferase [Anaeromyxobacter sp.]